MQFIAVTVFFAVGALLFENSVVHWTTEFVLALGWLAVVLSIGSIGLLYWLIRRSAATSVASLFYLVPAVTALMAYVLFDERLDGWRIVGMMACAAAVFLVNRRVRPRPSLRASRCSRNDGVRRSQRFDFFAFFFFLADFFTAFFADFLAFFDEFLAAFLAFFFFEATFFTAFLTAKKAFFAAFLTFFTTVVAASAVALAALLTASVTVSITGLSSSILSPQGLKRPQR